MSIIQNAIESIQIGIEDFENSNPRRNVSAVRNISAGILLLYKEKLCRLSPDYDKELLIRQNLRPFQEEDGTIRFEGKGHKTVDVQSIKERFSSLNVNVDWKRFDEINFLRNDLEHYFTARSPDAVREIVSKSFLLIRDFLVKELEEEPQELIGAGAWNALLNVSEVFSAEEAACKESIEKIDWKYSSVEQCLLHLRCPDCRSSLVQARDEEDLYPSVSLRCVSCGKEFAFNDVIEQCVDDGFAGEHYEAMTGGGEPPTGRCVDCGKSTYIHDEKCCVACEYQMEYEECERCSSRLTLEDQWFGGICGYCQHQYEKLMDE